LWLDGGNGGGAEGKDTGSGMVLKLSQVKRAFSGHGLPLATELVPEDPSTVGGLNIVLSSPPTADTMKLQLFVLIYRSKDDARSAEVYFREKGFIIGRALSPGEGRVLRARNILVQYDPKVGPAGNLTRAKAALAQLDGSGG